MSSFAAQAGFRSRWPPLLLAKQDMGVGLIRQICVSSGPILIDSVWASFIWFMTKFVIQIIEIKSA